MKKVLATVAALGLVLGVTANALALDQPGRASEVESTTAPRVPEPTAPGVALWSVAGQWVLAGALFQNGLGLPGGASLNDETGTDAFYIYSFKILPTLQVNDKISMEAEFRFADRDVFGATDTGLTPVTSGDSILKNSGRLIDTYTLWMNWVSPFGKTQFGRMPAGAWGTKFLNNSTQGNRLRWYPNMLPENWGSLLFMQKVVEQDAGSLSSDQDRDAYYVYLSYKAPFGKTTGALWAVRNAQGGGVPYTTTNFWLTGNYAFDALSLEYELNMAFGDASATEDAKAWGFYADAGWKMQDWQLGGLFIYASGDDDPTDTNRESIMSNATGTGKDFNPSQILFGDYMQILNGDMGGLSPDSINPAIQNGSGNAGVMAFGGYAKFALSPSLSFSGDLTYAMADKKPSGYDKEYGIEAGVGMGYKLMDNLTYNAHFSYLWTGDYFKQGVSGANVENVYLLAHALSMSF
ncbi:MAG: hypothetical protein WA992_12780 [Desulfobulbales bacterium]